MSDILAARVEKPTWFGIAPLKQGRVNRDVVSIGFDSEAEKGRPFLFQFAWSETDVDFVEVGRHKTEPLSLFLHYLYDRCVNRKAEYVVWGFNLQYEFTQLFGDVDNTHGQFYEPEFGLRGVMRDGEPWLIRAFNDKRYKFSIEFTRKKQTIQVVDAMAFFPMSLDAASKIVDAPRKLAKPEAFTRAASRTRAFRDYARRDAIITYLLGVKIIEWHEWADVRLCFTAPMLAMRTFRRKYLQSKIDDLNPDLEQYGLYTYHGGKNGYYADRPQLLKDVYNYDIRSAYPEAMAALPCVEHGEWEYHDGYQAGAHALYRCNISYRPCGYDPAYNLDGTRFRSRRGILWCTGYELDSMVARGEITVYQCSRWEFRSGCACGEKSALRAYVRDFYRLKKEARNPAERAYAKLNMNSLYGKFFQKQPLGTVGILDMETEEYIAHDPTEPYDYRAGGLYHPPFASLITGFVRAKIHELEHKYHALMTSTDGFFATEPPDAADIGNELGQLDVSRGELRIWRERLYIFTPRDGGKAKYALHGFHGGVELLRRVPLSLRAFHYRATEMVTLKRARNLIDGQRHGPGEFVERPFVLSPMKAGP